MNKNVFKIISVILACAIMLTGLSVASSAAVEIIDEKLTYGSEIAEKKDYNIVPGVTESYVVTQNDDGTNRVNSYVLEIDMNNPEIGIIASYKDYMNGLGDASWGMQAVRDQAVETEDYYRNTVGNKDFEIIAGVNGDFFNMGNGAPTGTFVMNSKYYHVNEDWPYFAILEDGTAIIRDRNDPVVDNIAQAVGGPEVIIKNGQLTDAALNSGYGTVAHPRTAVGIKANGDIVFVVSDGRQAPESCGQTFLMLAEEMFALGCVDALSLDGGGSASFVSQREGEDVLTLRNSPADGIERTVSTALLIYTNTETNKPTNTNKWFEKNGKIGYYDNNGVAVTGTKEIDGFTYTFDSTGALTSYAEINIDGTIARNRWSGTKYYLGEDGLPVKGTKTIGADTFTFNETTGVLEKSSLKNKWYECGQSVCYFDGNGNIVRGEQKIDNYTYTFDSDGKLTVYACVKNDGTLVKNQWVGKTYYLGENGLPVTGAQKLGKYTYTFGSDGKLKKGALAKEGTYTYYYIAGQRQRNWHNIDGYWHYFDRQTGFGMATSTNCDKVSIDFDRKDGLYTVSTTDAMLLFKFDSSGRLVRGAWLQTDYGKAYYWGNHERVTGWQTIDGATYYFNNDTYAVTGKYMVDNVMYGFDKDGKLEHTYTETEKVLPTCTTDGHASYVCNCGDEYTETMKALGHDYEQVLNAPTCTQIGINTKTCKRCGDRQIEYVNATGHTYEETVTAPTCTEKGFTTFTCSCGSTYTDNYVDATGHTFTISEVVAPTCTKQGYTVSVCSCGQTKNSKYVSATGHSYEAVVTAPTCTEKGFTIFTCSCGDTYTDNYADALGHDYTTETTTPTTETQGFTTYTCNTCDYVFIGDYKGAIGHDYVSVVTDPTCTVNGYTTYTCDCGLSYISDTIEAKHDYKEVSKTAPTCTQKGYTTYICNVCGENTDDNFINATGHSYTEEFVEPTCTQDGCRTLTCSCGDKIIEYSDPKGHDYDEAVVTEMTCTQDGFTSSTCKVCGDVFIENLSKAPGHKYESVITEATTESKGYTTYTCFCGYTYIGDYVGAIGHNYLPEITAPSCTEKGFTTYTCQDCEDDSYIADFVNATGHDYTQTFTNPTCTENGYVTFSCHCGDTYKGGEIAATGHTASDWIEIKPADTKNEGLEHKKCSVCQTILEERIIPVIDPSKPGYVENPEVGDVNADGKITAADARLALRIAAKLEIASPKQTKIADYNTDGKITAADARLILRKAAKLEP